MSILSVGQSALSAAQAGLVTTGHNIANAATLGFNRQEIVQTAASGQDLGTGFIGKGTEVTAIRRVYSEFLNTQTTTARTIKGQSDAYYAQIKQVDNMFADPRAGLTPTLQGFFSGVSAVSSDPNSAAARQTMLSSANALAGRFQSMDSQLSEMRQGVNTQIQSSTASINVYAAQIGTLNDAIEKAALGGAGTPNDLMDQRDQAVAEISKEIKVSVVKQGNTYNVVIGNGQPLVLNGTAYKLSVLPSDTDPSKLQVAYESGGKTVMLPDESLSGGTLGGVLQFRSKTLDPAQNALGRIAITFATEVNKVHEQGQDINGEIGGAFFQVASPQVTASSRNPGGLASKLTATINPDHTAALTTSDYRVQVTSASPDPDTYSVIRLSDNVTFAGSPAEVDGVQFALGGVSKVGDAFLVRPTAGGAASRGGLSVLINDPSKIAVGSPVRATAGAANTGTGTVGPASAVAPGANLTDPVSVRFTDAKTFDIVDKSGNVLSGGMAYSAGADISYNGWKMQISGAPAAGDVFNVAANTGATGDNSNALALANLQTTKTTDGNFTFQGAYSALVNQVGNKTRELEVTSAAADQVYSSASSAEQAVSGVNLDEEAANLLKYQQAYQAAGKVMKAASDMFNVLLSLGQ